MVNTIINKAYKTKHQRKKSLEMFKRNIPLHLMLFPGIIIALIFSYGPMIGLVMAFQHYNPFDGFFGSPWVGLENFKFLMSLPDTYSVIWNTFFIAVMKIIASLIVPIIVSLLLNEVGNYKFKRTTQTIIYFPHFVSWVILASVFIDILSPSTGAVNAIIKKLGFEPIFFLGSAKWFPFTMVLTHTWKEFGYGTIIYLAALTGIDPTLYEAAVIDGANRWQQTIHVTLPGMKSIIVLSMTLSLGNVLNAGFDQIYNMLTPIVYSTGDIIDTMVYRMGMIDAQYSLATAVGLFKSFVSLILISTSYWLAGKFANYRIF